MSTARELSHAAQASALDAVRAALPLDMGTNITVLDFGEVKVENEAPEFHNLVQLYPLGYRCQMLVPNLRTLAHDLALFEFEIGEEDGGPQFSIKNVKNGQIFTASTERGVLKKLEALGGYGGDQVRSFFNLEIELLIEGLTGALECSEYKFHEERGYPDQYSTQDQLVHERTLLLNNSARERRKARRDVLKQLSPEEQKRAEMLEKRRMTEEKEEEKLQQTVERERKKMEATAAKRDKEIALKEAKRLKEEAKQEKKLNEDIAKAEEKQRKERAKLEEKYRTIYRRGIKQEIRRSRQEALMTVLAFADAEDNAGEEQDLAYVQQLATSKAGKEQVEKMERIIAEMPSLYRS